MSVTLSARTVPITSTRSKTDVVRVRPSSTSGVPVDSGPLEKLAVTRGAEEIKEMYTEGARPSASAEAPGVTRANLRRLEGKDPVVAALASVVSSMPLFKTSPTPQIAAANAMVNALRGAARKGEGKEASWEQCSELRGMRRRSRYLRAKWTRPRRPKHLSGNPTGCLENL